MAKSKRVKHARDRSIATVKSVAPPPPASPFTIAIILLTFSAAFIALNVFSYTQKSATWDEPIHVTDGYAALTRHDYRIDPEHPPFLRMWAALPLVTIQNIKLETESIDKTVPMVWVLAK